jgi:hypothetical protein
MALLAHYPLNGDTLDYSGNGLNATNYGATIDNNGKIGKCYSFDGITNYITLPIALSKNPYGSICMWFNPTSFYNYNTLWDTPINADDWECWIYQVGIIKTRIEAETVEKDLNVLGGIGKWYHIVFTWEKDKSIKLYVNGILYATNTANSWSDSGDYMSLGGEANTKGTGKMNDVRIYDHALTDKEVYELSKAKILHYKFDDFQEPTTNYCTKPDFSSNWFASPVATNEVVTVPFTDGTIIKALKHMRTNTGDSYCGIDTPYVGVANKSFTLSFWVRSDINTTIAAGSGVQDTVTWLWPCTKGAISVTPQWQYVTVSGVAASNSGDVIRIILRSPTELSVPVYYAYPQLEQKDHATPCVTGTRAGIINDCSGYKNHGLLLEATTPIWTDLSRVGDGCYNFNGSTQYINTLGNSILEPEDITVSAWINMDIDAPIGRNIFLTKWLGYTCEIEATTRKPYFKLEGVGSVYSNTNLVLGNWCHFVGIFKKGEGAKIFIDGILTGTLSSTNTSITYTTNRVLNIGRYEGGIYFKGKIDDVRIYATALSDTEVKTLYQSRAALDNKGNLYVEQIQESINIGRKINDAIKNKAWQNGLNFYSQPNCQIDITDKGYHIYRPPNLIYPDAGNTMWGGLKVHLFNISPNILLKGHKYKVSFNVTGKSSVASGAIYFSNLMGWGGINGLTSVARSDFNSLEANFNGTKRIYATFDITDDIFKVCTTSYAAFVAGTSYNCYVDLCWGFDYSSTGSMGTDLYITDFRVDDITLSNMDGINQNGTYSSLKFNEVGPIGGLAAWWKLNGDTKDYSGNNNHATNNGPVITSGLNQKAYSFDGVDDYMTIPNDIVTNVFSRSSGLSYTSNIRLTTIGIKQFIISQQIGIGYSSCASGGIYIDSNNTACMQCYDDTGAYRDAKGATILQQNVDYTIIGVYNPTDKRMRIYVNGVLDGTSDQIGTFSRVDSNASNRIGMLISSNVSQFYFNGKISNLRVYNRNLTDEEVQILHKITTKSVPMQVSNNGTLYLSGKIKEV